LTQLYITANFGDIKNSNATLKTSTNTEIIKDINYNSVTITQYSLVCFCFEIMEAEIKRKQ